MSARRDPLAVLDMAADWMDDNPNTTVTYSGDVRQARADIVALVEAVRAYDAYMLDAGYSGPGDSALHPKAAENWKRIRAATAPFGDPK